MTKVNPIFKNFSTNKTPNIENNKQHHPTQQKVTNEKEKNILKYSLIGTGLVLSLVAFFNRKAISKFLKKIFNKTKPDDIKPASIIPDPKFTCGPENPTKYAQEKKAYLDEIMPKLRLKSTAKEDKVKIINAIEKYGTWEQGEKITGLMGFDEDIITACVKAIAATADIPRRAVLITSYINRENHNYKPETYLQILESASKIGDVKAMKNPDVLLKPIKRLLTHENADVRKAAQDALTAVTTKTGDIKIASIIPDPKFTCGPENPTKYAQEKKAYLDEIMPKLRQTTTSKEDEIKIINAIEKYGTWEHGEKITGLMGFDEDIIKAVVRAIAQTATNPDDVLIITSYINRKNHNYKPETYIQILNSAAKLGDVRSLGDDSKIMLDPIKKLLTHENADVRKAAQDALTAVTTKTGDIKIARN